MIQAGTIRTGSGRTLPVAGVYWMSSISALRITTLPGVTATSLPGSKPAASLSGLPCITWRTSSRKFRAPRTKLRPPSAMVARRISGFVQTKLDGETVSSIWRAANATTSEWALVTPGTAVVACRHHSSLSRKAWAKTLKGGRDHAGSSKRRSRGAGFIQCSGAASLWLKAAADCASASPRPGALARCKLQSIQASSSDAGESEPVQLAWRAWSSLSEESDAGSTGGKGSLSG